RVWEREASWTPLSILRSIFNLESSAKPRNPCSGWARPGRGAGLSSRPTRGPQGGRWPSRRSIDPRCARALVNDSFLLDERRQAEQTSDLIHLVDHRAAALRIH